MNNEEVISHHGILGMRWGIRRYQNPDGSLTPAGRKRAQKLKGEYKALTGKKIKGKIPNVDPRQKKIKDLNMTELESRMDRAKKTKQTLDDEANSYTSFKATVLRKVVAPAAVDAGKNVLQNLLEASLSKALGLEGNRFKEVKKEVDKEINKEIKNTEKDFQYYQEKQRQKEVKRKEKNAQKQATENRNAWERQQEANRDAWERQQEANRDFIREMAKQREWKTYDASDIDKGKTVVKDAHVVSYRQKEVSDNNQYYLPYKK